MRQELSEKAGTSDLLCFEVPLGCLAAAKNRKDEMKKEIQVSFEIEIEEKDRFEFQAGGHMFFQLYGPGDTPEDLPIRRPWDGSSVFIATLKNNGTQLLRVMSDSEGDACKLLRESITDTLIANVRAAAIREFDYQQFLRLNEDRNRLAEFIAANYPQDHSDIEGASGIVDIALHYLRIERRRWIVRFGHLFRRGK